GRAGPTRGVGADRPTHGRHRGPDPRGPCGVGVVARALAAPAAGRGVGGCAGGGRTAGAVGGVVASGPWAGGAGGRVMTSTAFNFTVMNPRGTSGAHSEQARPRCEGHGCAPRCSSWWPPPSGESAISSRAAFRPGG